MSNYLAKLGYQDLQLINRSDIFSYSVLTEQQTETQPVEEKGYVNIKQKGEEVIAMLKGMTK